MSIDRGQTDVINQFKDPSFSSQTILEYAAKQLKIPEEKVADAIYEALPAEDKNDANKRIIERALKFSVNASGSIMLLVNTNEEIALVHGDSQRRKLVAASNGACEAKESMEKTAGREFSEELGNPAKNGVLDKIVSDINNCRSIKETNKIGKTASDIAKRLMDPGVKEEILKIMEKEQEAAKKNKPFTESKCGKLYINQSSLYVNDSPVNITALKNELESLSAKLKVSAPFYFPAVQMVYGDKDIKPADLSDPGQKAKAVEQLNNFKQKCQANITSNFSDLFAKEFNDTTPPKVVKEALGAIIDLTENKAITYTSGKALLEVMSLDLKNDDQKKQLKEKFFAPSFEDFLAHRNKDEKSSDFINRMEKLASTSNKVTLGMQTQKVGEPKESVLTSNNKPKI